ncbi:MAG: hypothetical protein QF921_05230 [Pseudomonadales bacterium]|jgi:hypothetical protein|nr:hypothetical protein [Pseudomonadales bacterium]MDP6471913.1 hypothetical protein [Pseudomonadales bacterium]MDP6826817.1 hypothetical protein [Pseudomonadales bacterium]MDP6970905.1 hypothetical protein [Pseudomonadales bacterium]
MLLKRGLWLGKGSLLTEGASIGEPLVCDIEIVEDEGGFTITGDVWAADRPPGDVSIRIAPNEVGTYTMDVRAAGAALDGIAKMESEPNLGLLWNEAGTQSATYALFALREGYGFRGFARMGERTVTWEIAFALKQQAVGGANVVSLKPRRRR